MDTLKISLFQFKNGVFIMNKKLLTLGIMALLPLAMATSVQAQDNGEKCPPSSMSMQHGKWDHKNKFDEAFKDHPLSEDQKQQIRNIIQTQHEVTRQRINNVLTPDQQQDWNNFEASRMNRTIVHPTPMQPQPPAPPEDDDNH
jgi:Spy/CpxP family protein refolding chaperone